MTSLCQILSAPQWCAVRPGRVLCQSNVSSVGQACRRECPLLHAMRTQALGYQCATSGLSGYKMAVWSLDACDTRVQWPVLVFRAQEMGVSTHLLMSSAF